MHIQEIPPFRKKSTDSADHTGSSASSSPQRTTMRQLSAQREPQQQTIPEIPPYKTRKISAESAMHLNMSVRSGLTRCILIAYLISRNFTPPPPFTRVSLVLQMTYCVCVAAQCIYCVCRLLHQLTKASILVTLLTTCRSTKSPAYLTS